MNWRREGIFIGVVAAVALVALVAIVRPQVPATEALYGSAVQTASPYSASREHTPASHAFDDDSATSWIAGSHPPQWIQIDLGSAQPVRKIRLVVEQYPEGVTTHYVLGSNDRLRWQLLARLQQYTRSGDALTVQPLRQGPYRYVRVYTLQSPSWVAWKEIAINKEIGAPPGPCRISVRGDRFYCGEQRFVPRGNNHVLVAQVPHPKSGTAYSHALFNPLYYDHDQQRAVLRKMRQDGYNVVRVFVEETSGDTPQNVADFLKIADQEDMYVYLTFSQWLPARPEYTVADDPLINNLNKFYLTPQGVQAWGLYYSDFIRSLKAHQAPLHRVFAYDLVNELHLREDKKPLNLSSGVVSTTTGTYSLATQKEEMMILGLAFFINESRTAIQREHPGALVTASFFPPSAVAGADPRIIPAPGHVIKRSSADFADLHAYPGWNTLQQIAADAQLANYQTKPLVLGEFGILLPMDIYSAAMTLANWQITSCTLNFDGWFLWAWDHGDYSALRDRGAINGVLAPILRPDPCK